MLEVCFYGGGVVLCGVQEGCFAGVKSSALQGMILLLFNHSFVGEKWGVPPWGLTNLIRCDISEIANTIFLDVIILIMIISFR